jgi:hypothetical protein
MRVRPAIPGAVIRDPHTKRPLPADGGEVPENGFWIRRTLPSSQSDAEVWVRDGAGWIRRMRDGRIERMSVDAPLVPAGNEPIAPLTTRGTR